MHYYFPTTVERTSPRPVKVKKYIDLLAITLTISSLVVISEGAALPSRNPFVSINLNKDAIKIRFIFCYVSNCYHYKLSN